MFHQRGTIVYNSYASSESILFYFGCKRHDLHTISLVTLNNSVTPCLEFWEHGHVLILKITFHLVHSSHLVCIPQELILHQSMNKEIQQLHYAKDDIQCDLLFRVTCSNIFFKLMYFFYQIKMLMFYGVQTTNSTMVVKNEMHCRQL